MDNNWVELLQDSNQLARLVETNNETEKYGLTLTEEDAQMILEERKNVLRGFHSPNTEELGAGHSRGGRSGPSAARSPLRPSDNQFIRPS